MSSTMDNNKIMKMAMEYGNMGWKLVPLHAVVHPGVCSCQRGADCPNPGKHPRMNSWKEYASCDEETIVEWFNRWGMINVGILLGPESGLIDVEFDTEEGRSTAQRLFEGIITPTYHSGRSTHRLFRWSKDLPAKQKIETLGLEIRIGGDDRSTQSVAPPSRHGSGKYYEWQRGCSPDECDPLPLPDDVLNLIHNRKGLDAKTIFDANDDGPTHGRDIIKMDVVRETEDGRNNALYAFACRQARLHANMLDDPTTQHDIFEILSGMNLKKCMPPLDEKEVLAVMQSAFRFIRSQPLGGDASSGPNYTEWGLEWNTELNEWDVGNWQLTVVRSDPVHYKLNVPAWAYLTNDKSGDIFLACEDYLQPAKVARQILLQTGEIVVETSPGTWASMWNGAKRRNGPPARGLKAKLMDKRQYEDATPVDKRYVIIAEYLHEKLSRADCPDSDEPNENGMPVIRKDGSVWFRWMKIWEDGRMTGRIAPLEPANFKKRIGITSDNFKLWPHRGPNRKRYCVLYEDQLDRLQQILDGDVTT